MDEKTARLLAQEIVQRFLEPFFSSSKSGKYPPLTITELIYVGAYFTRSMVEFGFDPRDDEVYSLFNKYPPDLGRLEDLLCTRLLDGKENMDDILGAMKRIEGLTHSPGSFRGLFLSLAKKAIPAGKPGRHSKIQLADLSKLATSSDELLPACSFFLKVRKVFPKRSSQEILDFLDADFPKQIEQMVVHQQTLNSCGRTKRFFEPRRLRNRAHG